MIFLHGVLVALLAFGISLIPNRILMAVAIIFLVLAAMIVPIFPTAPVTWFTH